MTFAQLNIHSLGIYDVLSINLLKFLRRARFRTSSAQADGNEPLVFRGLSRCTHVMKTTSHFPAFSP
jgi:hypothetical protein